MKSNKTLLDELNNKLEKEYNEFIQEIIKLDPLSIINKTYENLPITYYSFIFFACFFKHVRNGN